MKISPMRDREVMLSAQLVLSNWGPVAADRFVEQAFEGLKGGKYAPKFFVAHIFDDESEDDTRGIIGMCAYQRSMRMNNHFDLIWLAVHEMYQGKGIGSEMTGFRLEEIRKQGGTCAFLVTQKPKYFHRFGFMTAAHVGNNWVEMYAPLKPSDIG